MAIAMSYQIIEIPDHLHRGLHVFAAANLEAVLAWLDMQVNTLQEPHLAVEERWFLDSINSHGLTRDSTHRRLLARKEDQKFFKKHSEMRNGEFRRLASKSVVALRLTSPTEFERLCGELLGQFGLRMCT